MKTNNIIAIALIILWIVVFAYQGITHKTTEKAINLGPIQVTAEKSHTIPLPPIVGAVALVGGILLLLKSGKRLERQDLSSS